jgi:hypothetical protein
MLEAADGPPGSLDRAHHNPRFDEALSADPVQWVGAQLSDLAGLLETARGCHGRDPGGGR